MLLNNDKNSSSTSPEMAMDKQLDPKFQALKNRLNDMVPQGKNFELLFVFECYWPTPCPIVSCICCA